MYKRVQRRSRQRSINIFTKESAANSKRPLESLRELIGLATAGAGIFAALLYLAGRSFANSYFAAMNIPGYQVSFSLWEYGEVAWLPLFLYPIGMIILSSFLGGVFSTISDLTSPLCAYLWDWLKKKIKFRLPALHLPEQSRKTKLWFAIANYVFIVLLFVFIIIFTLQAVSQYGKLNGQLTVLENAAQIELISAVPLGDNNLAAVQSSGQGYYFYKGFHLLTFNNGKYYLFKEIDSVTCKPSQVYVIDSANLVQVNIAQAVSLEKECSKNIPKDIISIILFLFSK